MLGVLQRLGAQLTDTTTTTTTTVSGAGLLVFGLIALVFVVFYTACLWKVFTKAGEKGWKAIIPIWNTIVLLRISGRPLWWVLLFFIPIVNLVVAIIMYIDLAKAFGKGVGFALGLVFLGFIFFPILAFGGAQYRGSANAYY